MMVGVDEAWGDDFLFAVDDLSVWWWLDVLFDLGDIVILDKKVGIS